MSRICVDVLMNHGWRLGPSCHLFHLNNNLDELHVFAAKLGMRRSWFQDERRPHYDLVASRRERAVSMGAREVTRQDADYVAWIRSGRPLPKETP